MYTRSTAGSSTEAFDSLPEEMAGAHALAMAMD